MKRDFNLIRLILLALESAENRTSHPRIEGALQEEIAFQLEMLLEAGLIQNGEKTVDTIIIGGGYRLTWRGSDFLDSIRTPERWRKVKLVIEKASGLTFDVVKTIATQILLKEVTG